MKKIKILYLTGYGKSGATLIGRHLGTANNAFFVGEIKYFWRYGIQKNYECTCGEKFDSCSFWKRVTDEYLASFPGVNMEEIGNEFYEFEKLKNYFKLKKVEKNKGDNEINSFLKKYLEHNEKLYETIAKESGKEILVDISRLPGRLHALSFSDKFEIYPVYLMRDPRGVLNSFIQADLRYYSEIRHNILRQLITWNVNTFFSIKSIKKFSPGKFLFILYSDYVKDPSKELKQLNGLIEGELDYEVKDGKVYLYLEQGHVFAGNRSRFKYGDVNISEDAKWKHQLNEANKSLASIISYPFYKYLVTRYHNF